MAMLGPANGSRQAGLSWAGRLARLALALLAFAGLARPVLAQSVTTYRGAADRGGLYVTPGLTWAKAADVKLDPAFAPTVSGQVYAQPLYWLPPGASTGLVIVATESNVVYALRAATGAVVWQRALGTPVTSSQLPCGNINPIGVTGTPVIDPTTETLYLDALVSSPGGPQHRIFALALATGKLVPGWSLGVDSGLPALGLPFTSASQGQRSGLTIVEGSLYVTYGGNWGDCATYHGTIAEVPLGAASPKITAAWETRALGGGIWAQSGIAYDGQSMFVATGNTRGTRIWGDGEAVIRVRPGLKHSALPADNFAPANWLDLDNIDTDLGGTGPIPINVPAGGGTTLARLLALGKDGRAYLLDRADLGGIGGQLAVAHVSNDAIISAAARFPTADAAMVTFVGSGSDCPARQSGNLTMLRITASKTAPIATAWCASFNGTGAPIVTTTNGTAEPIVWVAGAKGDDRLDGFRGTDGTPLVSVGGLSGLQRNAAILVAEGRFYVAGSGKVFAFTY
jgi:hypothetical protein